MRYTKSLVDIGLLPAFFYKGIAYVDFSVSAAKRIFYIFNKLRCDHRSACNYINDVIIKYSMVQSFQKASVILKQAAAWYTIEVARFIISASLFFNIMQKNYRAWDVNIEEFYKQKTDRDRTAFLVRFAVLAPSSHNAQPWKFAVSDDAIAVMPDTARMLGISDADGRHMHIAMGCAIENICIAADYYGYHAHVTPFPADSQEAVASIVLEKAEDRAHPAEHLIFSIPKRRSDRNPYAGAPPPEKLLLCWKRPVSENFRVDAVTDYVQRAAIADILVGFREDVFARGAFRRELARYKRTNFTRDFVGMPGFTMGFSTAFSLIAPFLIRHINVIKLTRNKDLNVLIEHTPVFIFLSTKEDAKTSWLDAGRMFQRMLLEAERDGLHTSISAVPHPSSELRAILGTAYYPQIFFRVGYANKVPQHSPRLASSQVIIYV